MFLSSISIPLFFKLPLLVSDAVCMRISGTPPNPPTSSGRVVVPDWRENFLRSLGYPSMALRTMSWLAQFIEFTLIVAHYNPNGPISNFTLKILVAEPSCMAKISITPLFMVGSVLNFLGTVLRVQCYRRLGRFFTFELRVQTDHQLITDGPYAVVRHPSYTALICTVLGVFYSHASGSWISECGLVHNPLMQALAGFWMLVASAVILSLVLRVDREDDMLKKAFDDSWMKWSRKVPYKLIPGIY